MRAIKAAGVVWLAVALGAGGIAADDAAPSIERLLESRLERVSDTEVILSRVRVPPNTTLPRHWHPGEEFVYVIEGSVTLILEGDEPREFGAGDVARVPLERVHTATAGDDGTLLVVFRVHESGKPERHLVTDDPE